VSGGAHPIAKMIAVPHKTVKLWKMMQPLKSQRWWPRSGCNDVDTNNIIAAISWPSLLTSQLFTQTFYDHTVFSQVGCF